MSRLRVSTTVDEGLLTEAQRSQAGANDAAVLDDALKALLASRRWIDASYAAYDEHPLDEPDEWGDLAAFRDVFPNPAPFVTVAVTKGAGFGKGGSGGGQAAIDRVQAAYPLPDDDPIWRRARGWAVWRAFGCLGIAAAGPPGGKPSWGPPAVASLRRLAASMA